MAGFLETGSHLIYLYLLLVESFNIFACAVIYFI